MSKSNRLGLQNLEVALRIAKERFDHLNQCLADFSTIEDSYILAIREIKFEIVKLQNSLDSNSNILISYYKPCRDPDDPGIFSFSKVNAFTSPLEFYRIKKTKENIPPFFKKEYVDYLKNTQSWLEKDYDNLYEMAESLIKERYYYYHEYYEIKKNIDNVLFQEIPDTSKTFTKNINRKPKLSFISNRILTSTILKFVTENNWKKQTTPSPENKKLLNEHLLKILGKFNSSSVPRILARHDYSQPQKSKEAKE